MTNTPIRLMLNGQERVFTCEGLVSLAQVLRDEAHLTSIKIGCAEGYCGSCAVVVDGEPVVSCLMPAVACDGVDIRTSEQLIDESDARHMLREELCAIDGVQCGMCIPGLVMTVGTMIEAGELTESSQVENALMGSICRCSGYTRIVQAIESVLDRRVDR